MSKYDIKITGKNLTSFIKNLHKMKIQLYNISYQDKSVIIRVDSDDYKRIFDIIPITDIIIKDLKKINHPNDSLVSVAVMILTDYTIQQRYVKNIKDRHKFINDAFDYLEDELRVPDIHLENWEKDIIKTLVKWAEDAIK